jgi:hypothetical protein
MDTDGERLREHSHFERGSIANRVDLFFGADEGLSERAMNMRHAHGAPIEAHLEALVLAAMRQYLQALQGRLGLTATRSRGFTLVTAAPTSSTVAATSWPRIIGSRRRTAPKPPWLK